MLNSDFLAELLTGAMLLEHRSSNIEIIMYKYQTLRSFLRMKLGRIEFVSRKHSIDDIVQFFDDNDDCKIKYHHDYGHGYLIVLEFYSKEIPIIFKLRFS